MNLSTDVRRHTGILDSTGSRIYLVFRKIPGDEENCLVIMADALPDQISQNLEGLVLSREGQGTCDLHEVFHRHKFKDGSNVLLSLHERKLLQKMPVSGISMTPLADRTVPLSVINHDIDFGTAVEDDSNVVATMDTASNVPTPAPVKAEAVVAVEEEADPMDSMTDAEKAKYMMKMSQDLKKQAEDLKKQAQKLNPKIKAKAGRPAESASDAEKKAKRNAQRRKSYAEKNGKSGKA